ncbi:hypothetical protein FSP39_022123 [Pinctada imbricata]|uniref:Peroxin-19 n=1 Tax=Pinctada imbricata TaxID=66713 RepID=A0AA88YBA6_PINIB|nr:hypothetical protein FSP39_022123 [Pinctada imbricata]
MLWGKKDNSNVGHHTVSKTFLCANNNNYSVLLPSGVNVDTSEMFAEEFSDEMARQFQEAMQGIVGNDANFMQQIEKLAEAAGKSGESQEAQQEFAQTLSSTLNSMAENSEHLQDDMTDEDLMKAFTSMGMEDSPDNIMQGMMKTLLSKEVLYPSLKELSQKYPKWITENRGKVDKAQMSNYEQQEILVREICKEFESENASDSSDVQKHRFETIVDLMQQMQELGQPPKEIVGDMAPGLEFDQNGMPKMPGAPEGCSIM